MADFNSFHALGQAQTAYNNDPRFSQPQAQSLPPNSRPPIAPSPVGYHQSGASYANVPQQYGGAPQSSQAVQEGGYSPPQGQAPMGDLSSHMGSLGITSDTSGPSRSHRRKERHAYHDISQPTAPGPGTGTQGSQYLNAGQTAAGIGQAYTGQQSQPLSKGVSGQMNAADTLRSGEESVATQGRVDPEQIPSVPRSRDLPAQYYLDNVYPTMEKHTPP